MRVLAAALALLLAACGGSAGPGKVQLPAAPERPVGPFPGMQLADLELVDLDGKATRLSELRGEAVFINLWATWCKPCLAELPALETLHTQLGGADHAVVMTLSVDSPTVSNAKLRGVLGKHAPSLGACRDPTKTKVSAQTLAQSLPLTVVIDRWGTIRYRMAGPREWQDPAYAQRLAELAAESVPPSLEALPLP